MNYKLLANGRTLVYRLNGRASALPLVLVHGFCEDATVWDTLLPLLRGLYVVRPNLPGFGGSDLPLAPDITTYADAVCALLNELAVDRCVLVGHSMGGYAALEFGHKYPERLAGLGLFHSHPFVDTPEKKQNRTRGIEQLRSGKKDLYVAQLFAGLFTPAFAEAHPEVPERLVRRARRYPEAAIAAALEAMRDRPDRLGVLQEASWPVWFLLGRDDQVVTAESALPAVHHPAVASLHLLPGVAHMGMFEAPEDSATRLREFWTFCRQAGGPGGKTNRQPA